MKGFDLSDDGWRLVFRGVVEPLHVVCVSRVCLRWHRLLVEDVSAWPARGWSSFGHFVAFFACPLRRMWFFMRTAPYGHASGALARIAREYLAFERDPPPCCFVRVPQWGNNALMWHVTIKGPLGTPYEGGWFVLEVTFPVGYPFKPPRVIFKTKIYHPNVGFNGAISVDILQNMWSPALTTQKVLLSLMWLMSEPNPDDPQTPEVAHLMKTDRAKYDETARHWTKTHASNAVPTAQGFDA